MATRLVTDELIEEAQRSTGLERFDSQSFREGLDVIVADVNQGEARPPELLARLRYGLVKALADRLKVTAALEARPELLTRPITRPVFVFGIPRTGTTLLNNLLAADPNRRSPLKWELDDPVPPPTADELYTGPRALAALEMDRKMQEMAPSASKYYRGSAIYPHECVWILAHDFRTLMWESAGKLPLYREWFFNADATPAYEYHKKFLQLHQADAPGIWNLKMPSHILNLQTLLKIYPDARLVWTHRDPYTATGSLCSLITLGHMAYMGKIDKEWLGENYPWQAAEHARRGMAARDAIGEDRIIDVHYADMTRDPMGTMRKLYKQLGDELTPEAETAMQGWVDDNPQDKFGRHEYKLAQFGLTKEKLEPMFAEYLRRYPVEMEG
jgi:Sulfotransferase family